MDTITAFLTEYLKAHPDDITTVSKMLAALAADTSSPALPQPAEKDIIMLYAKGIPSADIKSTVNTKYNISLSDNMLQSVINKSLTAANDWQNRPLSDSYAILYPYTLHCHAKINGILTKVPVYCLLGMPLDGRREALGIYTAHTAADWSNVFADLKNRCALNLAAACSDNSAGFNTACAAAFPNAEIYGSIIHLSADTVKRVRYKDIKPVKAALKQMHTAPDENVARMELDIFADNWDKIYTDISKPWFDNWRSIAPIFDMPQTVRRIFYTYNTLEEFSAGMRKTVDTTAAFADEDKMLITLRLAAAELTKKWKGQRQDWSEIKQDLDKLMK